MSDEVNGEVDDEAGNDGSDDGKWQIKWIWNGGVDSGTQWMEEI